MYSLFTWFTERVIEVPRLTSAVVRGASKSVTVVGVEAVTALATLPAVTVGGAALRWKQTTSTLWTEVPIPHLIFIIVFFQKNDKYSHVKKNTHLQYVLLHFFRDFHPNEDKNQIQKRLPMSPWKHKTSTPRTVQQNRRASALISQKTLRHWPRECAVHDVTVLNVKIDSSLGTRKVHRFIFPD